MHQRSIATAVSLWLLRVALFIVAAYGIGYLAGYYINIPIVWVAGLMCLSYFLYCVWRDKRSRATARVERG